MAELALALQWCNGGHYFPLQSESCPDSGYADLSVRARLIAAIQVGERFEELIAAGVPERDLLHVILCPAGITVMNLVSPCSGVISLRLAKLISDRNALILRAFPDGILRTQLDEDAATSSDAEIDDTDLVPGSFTSDLHLANERAEAFQRREFPLIPGAHLNFLGLFYR